MMILGRRWCWWCPRGCGKKVFCFSTSKNVKRRFRCCNCGLSFSKLEVDEYAKE